VAENGLSGVKIVSDPFSKLRERYPGTEAIEFTVPTVTGTIEGGGKCTENPLTELPDVADLWAQGDSILEGDAYDEGASLLNVREDTLGLFPSAENDDTRADLKLLESIGGGGGGGISKESSFDSDVEEVSVRFLLLMLPELFPPLPNRSFAGDIRSRVGEAVRRTE
jgi:hypothetical protein